MSTLDANKYRVNVPLVATYLKDKGPEERVECIGRLAVMTGAPICIVAVYVGELFGFTEELNEKLEQLKKFYTVDSIDNIISASADKKEE